MRRPAPTAVAAALTLVVALVLTACGSSDPAATGEGAVAPTSAAPATDAPPPVAGDAPATVPESFRFTGTTVDGAPFDGADHAGEDLVLWFWAPW